MICGSFGLKDVIYYTRVTCDGLLGFRSQVTFIYIEFYTIQISFTVTFSLEDLREDKHEEVKQKLLFCVQY